jgi:hypothetical protein
LAGDGSFTAGAFATLLRWCCRAHCHAECLAHLMDVVWFCAYRMSTRTAGSSHDLMELSPDWNRPYQFYMHFHVGQESEEWSVLTFIYLLRCFDIHVYLSVIIGKPIEYLFFPHPSSMVMWLEQEIG